MSGPDDLDSHLETLIRLKLSGADDVYRRALEAANSAVARVIFDEAEHLAGVGKAAGSVNVVPFRPGARRIAVKDLNSDS